MPHPGLIEGWKMPTDKIKAIRKALAHIPPEDFFLRKHAPRWDAILADL